MKRIGIITFNNLKYCPFIKYYTNIFDEYKTIEYEIIYYNRDRSLKEPNGEKYISVPWIGKGTNLASKLEKILNFMFWKVYVSRLLGKKEYDFIVVIMTTAAVLIEKTLTSKYEGKYIFDVRDYTQEHIKAFFESEKRLVAKSKLNVISSPGFKEFLPKSEYRICHNFTDTNDEKVEFQKKSRTPIQISYVGSIAYEKQCIKLMRLVNQDKRFSFVFYGNENTSHKVSKEIARLNNTRIRLMGPFMPDEKRRIYRESALVFNCYGNNHPLVLYAISNKHYDGARYRVPILNSPNTIMAKLAGEYSYIMELETLENLDELYKWYVNLNEHAYESYCERVINNAKKENEKTKRIIISAILD